jgi:RHS repeat-associated protein
MGYYYTTEPENAVPGKFHASPKTHTPGSRVKERGHRYYQPEVGRWLGRDPINERGFLLGVRLTKIRKQASDINDYISCANRLTMLVDPLGLQYCVTWTDPIFGGTYTACYDPTPPPPPPADPWSCCSKSECRKVAWNDFKDCRDLVTGFCAGFCLLAGPGYLECLALCEGHTIVGCFIAFGINAIRCQQCPNP